MPNHSVLYETTPINDFNPSEFLYGTGKAGGQQ
jgi:hypothetical protein